MSLVFNGVIPVGSKFDLIDEDDGFINVTLLCKYGGKTMNGWNYNKKSKELLKQYLHKYNIELSDIKKLVKAGCVYHTYYHPDIAIQIAQWISIDFAIQVSEWINEWRDYSIINEQKFIEKIVNIIPDENISSKEKEIQDRLCLELEGETEVECPVGFIDIVTDTEIIEVKHITKWKHALGQILSYSKYFPNHIKRLHLFEESKISLSIIKDICTDYNVTVTIE